MTVPKRFALHANAIKKHENKKASTVLDDVVQQLQ